IPPRAATFAENGRARWFHLRPDASSHRALCPLDRTGLAFPLPAMNLGALVALLACSQPTDANGQAPRGQLKFARAPLKLDRLSAQQLREHRAPHGVSDPIYPRLPA